MSILTPERKEAVDACIRALEEQEHERAARNRAGVAWYEGGFPVYWEELEAGGYPEEENPYD